MIEAEQVVRFTKNGILGVKDPQGTYDCSPQGPGARFWKGELAAVVTINHGRSVGRKEVYYQVRLHDGREGYVGSPDIE